VSRELIQNIYATKLTASMMMLVLLVVAAKSTAHANQNTEIRPISEDGLMMLLEKRIRPAALVQAINSRGVAFQLTSVFETELRSYAGYLTPKQLVTLLTTIRSNFRPPAIRPFRFTYRLLEGHAVDLFMDRKIGRQWDRVLAGKHFTIQNEVLRTLSDLVKEFSGEFVGDKFIRGYWSSRGNRRLATQYKSQQKRLFVGSSGELGGDPYPALNSSDIAALIRSLNDPNEPWHVKVFRGTTSDLFTFRKFVSRGDLALFNPTPLQEFYSQITKDYFPADFGMLQLNFNEDGCPVDLFWLSELLGPLLRLNLAIIENVSSEPVSVGRFIIKENRSDRLYSRQEVNTAFESQAAEKQYLFSPGILKPGESLVIPVELSLKVAEETGLADLGDEGLQVIPPANYAGVLKRIRAKGGIKGSLDIEGTRGRHIIVTAESLERIMSRGKPNFTFNSEYLYGPSVRIESVEINKFGYLLRRFDPSKLLITSAMDEQPFSEGSCPYVYTYSTREKTWVSEGVILYGNNSKLREMEDEKVLRRFTGKILIKEEDPEDSFIDSIYIKAVTSGGRVTILYPRDQKLRSVDQQYLNLRHGDQVFIEFDIPPGFEVHKYVLVARGFYLPYEGKLSDSTKRRRTTIRM